MADDPYRALFARYVEELEASRQVALAWWGELVRAEQQRGLGGPEARQAVIARWPCGPTSHPRVLGIYRQYFLACDELNRERQRKRGTPPQRPPTEDDWGTDRELSEEHLAGPVPPSVFAVDWLAGKHPELQTLLASLLLSPIGLADDGTFC